MIETQPTPGLRKTGLEEAEDRGEFELEPLPRGYGHTLGNALRRVLLSSLAGAAVTAVRIDGVQHEFTTVPDVKEDVTQIVLNLKKLRLRCFSEDPVKAYLDAPGPGVVTGSDVRWPESVEIVNPEQRIATLDSETARLSMELTVERGVGYVPAEAREGVPIGEIPVDAIYTPIRKVEYHVENARVGQVTNYDRLVMRIQTDGTVPPEEALARSAQILVEQFGHVASLLRPEDEEERPRVAALPVPPELAGLSVDGLELSNRTLNCLKRNNITLVGQLASLTEQDLLSLRNFGEKSLDELRERLQERGVPLGARADSGVEA